VIRQPRFHRWRHFPGDTAALEACCRIAGWSLILSMGLSSGKKNPAGSARRRRKRAARRIALVHYVGLPRCLPATLE